MSERNMPVKSFTLTDELIAKLSEAAKANDESESRLVRRAIETLFTESCKPINSEKKKIVCTSCGSEDVEKTTTITRRSTWDIGKQEWVVEEEEPYYKYPKPQYSCECGECDSWEVVPLDYVHKDEEDEDEDEDA